MDSLLQRWKSLQLARRIWTDQCSPSFNPHRVCTTSQGVLQTNPTKPLPNKDAYPLPRIEESLTSLKQAPWYSTLDLASGIWQVEIDPKDREKTAFTTPWAFMSSRGCPSACAMHQQLFND